VNHETGGLRPRVSPEDIESVIAPYIVERFDTDDPRWRATIERLARKERTRLERFTAGQAPVRDRALVERQYAEIWSRSVEDELTASPVTQFEWSRGAFLAHSIVRKRVHQLLLARTFDAIAPRSSLEVGCGNGLNLLMLSGYSPGVSFAGLELTDTGVRAAKDLMARPEPPAPMEDFAVAHIHDPYAYRRVRLHRGSAAQLPYRDNAFDIVFTVLALEQMESIRVAALIELRRVAARYVVMIEPFREWNADGLRRDYIAGKQYFNASVDELETYGLHPVFIMSDIPNKVSFHVGLVIAAVV
jgi:SAM-dependent methyltransferase